MIEKSNEQNQNQNEKNMDSNNIKNSPKENIIINNSIINVENMNNDVEEKNLNIINKEMKHIAMTGNPKLSWNELRSYVIFLYEKNIKNFCENSESPKNSSNINFVNNGEMQLSFQDKKDMKEEQMELNNNNEHSLLEDKNLNLIGDFHLSDESNLGVNSIKMNKENINDRNEKDENIEKDIVEFINKIKLMPFTIQRIAELLLEPKKYYSTLLKYNKAFYKLVNIDFD